MLNTFSSNAISAKARAIYGKRLTAGDYRELMRQRTVADVASYLKSSTSYGRYLAGIDEMQIHRGQLEVLLHRTKLEKFAALNHYNFARDSGFFSCVAMNAETDILLRTVMLLNSGVPQNIINNLPTFAQGYLSFDLMRLSKIKTFGDLLEVIRGTPYYAVLAPFSAVPGEIPLSQCELAMKTFYYKHVFGLIDKNYRGAVRRELHQAVMLEVELMNLAIVYRLKNYFNRSPEQIKAQLLPFSQKLSRRALDSLLSARDDQEFAAWVGRLSRHHRTAEIPFGYVEDYSKRLLAASTTKVIHFSISAPIVFFSLMTLIQLEIENLTTIIEGIRYKVAPSEIESLLILE